MKTTFAEDITLTGGSVLIRYPGSKDRTASVILDQLGGLCERRLCEPFAGTGAVTYEAIRRGLVDYVWLNDIDPFIVDLHRTVRDDHLSLVELISGYTPQVDDFYDWRSSPPTDSLTNAFRTIVLHQISFSGLGRKAGSPIGGTNQAAAKYKVDCRWNPALLRTKIRNMYRLLTSVDLTITSGDWSECPDWAWYVDPPYFEQGSALYSAGSLDHGALCARLMMKAEPWVLSYDDAAPIRDLYGSWAHVEHGLIETYLNHGRQRPNYRKQELLIWPKVRQLSPASDQLDLVWSG